MNRRQAFNFWISLKGNYFIIVSTVHLWEERGVYSYAAVLDSLYICSFSSYNTQIQRIKILSLNIVTDNITLIFKLKDCNSLKRSCLEYSWPQSIVSEEKEIN